MAGERCAPPFGLVLRLWLAVMVVAAVVAGLIAEVSGSHLRDRQEALRHDRFLHTARDLKIPLEGAVALGLPLEQAPRVQDMLEREHAAAGTLSIEVFDPQGRILFGTDRSFLGDLVTERWLERAGAEPWAAEDPDALVIGVPILNGFGGVVGTVAVRHAKAPAGSGLTLLAADRDSLWMAVGGAVVFAGLAFLTLSRLMARLGGDLAGAREALARPAPAAGGGALTAAANAAAAAARDAHARMESALETARKADLDA